jgi:hypothetical protein
MNRNLQLALVEEFRSFLGPIEELTTNGEYRRVVFAHLGWNVDALPEPAIDSLLEVLGATSEVLSKIDALILAPPESLADFAQALTIMGEAITKIRELQTAFNLSGIDVSADGGDVARRFIDYLTIHHLADRHPSLLHWLLLLTVVVPAAASEADVVLDDNGNVVRFPSVVPEIRLRRLSELLDDPVGVLGSEYFSNETFKTVKGAQRTADTLFPRLVRGLQGLGISAVYGIKPMYGFAFGELGDELIGGMLTLWIDSDLDEHGFGVTLVLSPEDRGGLGLVAIPFGDLNFSYILRNWDLRVALEGTVDAVAVGPHGITLAPEADNVDIRAHFVALKLPTSEDVPILAGSTTGTRLEIRHVAVTGGTRLASTERDSSLLVSFGSATFVVTPGEGDGFFRELLPPEGLRTDFELALGWSSRTGFFIHGGTQLESAIPVHGLTLGPISIDTMFLAVGVEADAITAMAAATAHGQLGPIGITLQRVGLEAAVVFPDGGGNLGPAGLQIGFKPPDGIGLIVDAGPITGGGFLSYDDTTGRYSGALELEVHDISVKAIGLLDTRLPGGKPAYSFLIIVSTEFTPIPIGLGFTLKGVGGLAGIHRRLEVDALRARLSKGSLDHILFSKNPIKDATQVVSDLQAVFPPTDDRYVFGPMAIIGWGTPTLLEGELAVLLELPDPARIILLGQFHVALPRKDKALIELNLDLIGEIDLDRQRFALDGRLRKSRVVSFPLDGDIAMRLQGGDKPNFALAIGGFNSAYTPPPGFPKLKRVTVLIGLDDNPRVTLEGYLALTSNTLQIGAAASVYAEAGWFNITGDISFNTLFTFSPFTFVTDFSGKVTLRKSKTDLAAISLEAVLSGPTPWHAVGEACLAIRFLPDICVGFDENFGREERVEVPKVDPWGQLQSAVQNRESWSGVRPAGVFRGATLGGQGAGDDVLIDPGFGVALRQSVVPLHRRITKFGEARLPKGSDRFNIENVIVAGENLHERSPTRDFFAPAQFEDLSKDEKLSRPSFERMDAGFSVAEDAVDHGASTDAIVDYETKIIDSAFETRLVGIYSPGREVQIAAATRGAGARAPLRNGGRSKFARPPAVQPIVRLDDERFVIASTVDLTKRSDITSPNGKGAAQQALAEYLARHPEERGRLDVMSLDELPA